MKLFKMLLVFMISTTYTFAGVDLSHLDDGRVLTTDEKELLFKNSKMYEKRIDRLIVKAERKNQSMDIVKIKITKRLTKAYKRNKRKVERVLRNNSENELRFKVIDREGVMKKLPSTFRKELKDRFQDPNFSLKGEIREIFSIERHKANLQAIIEELDRYTSYADYLRELKFQIKKSKNEYLPKNKRPSYFWDEVTMMALVVILPVLILVGAVILTFTASFWFLLGIPLAFIVNAAAGSFIFCC